MRDAPDAPTQLALESPTSLSLPCEGTMVGDLIDLRIALPRAPASTTPLPRRRPELDLGAELDAICARAARGPEVTGTLDAFHALEVPQGSPLATLEPWPEVVAASAASSPRTPVVSQPRAPVVSQPRAPVVSQPRTPVVSQPRTPVATSPALDSCEATALSSEVRPSRGARLELALLYTTVSLATFLGTVAILY
jgi:hypothetical protein